MARPAGVKIKRSHFLSGSDTPSSVLRECETDEDRFYRLADLYLDAREWRVEESEALRRLQHRIAVLEQAVFRIGAQRIEHGKRGEYGEQIHA